MRAGKLRKRIEIQAKTNVQNGFGEITDDWATFATVYASIEPMQGRELLTTPVVYADVTHTITLRYDPSTAITHLNRIKFGSRLFDIKAVVNVDERNRELDLLCIEVV